MTFSEITAKKLLIQDPRRLLTRRRTLAVLLIMAAAAWLLPAPETRAQNPGEVFRFQLVPNPKFVNCLARFPGDPSRPPTADVTVVKGVLNDRLTLSLHNIKPGLAFDLFTVQRSSLLADGTADPNVTNCGFAWYQSEVDATVLGGGSATINTVLLNEIFGFDPDATGSPINTFHVGLWFDDPMDAAPCGFDASKPTPFNGEHKAGPLAMISLPGKDTGQGPLLVHEK